MRRWITRSTCMCSATSSSSMAFSTSCSSLSSLLAMLLYACTHRHCQACKAPVLLHRQTQLDWQTTPELPLAPLPWPSPHPELPSPPCWQCSCMPSRKDTVNPQLKHQVCQLAIHALVAVTHLGLECMDRPNDNDAPSVLHLPLLPADDATVRMHTRTCSQTGNIPMCQHT